MMNDSQYSNDRVGYDLTINNVAKWIVLIQ